MCGLLKMFLTKQPPLRNANRTKQPSHVWWKSSQASTPSLAFSSITAKGDTRLSAGDPLPYSAVNTSQQQPVPSPYAYFYRPEAVIIVDNSASIPAPRWIETTEALRVIASICTRYGTDGADLCFFTKCSSSSHGASPKSKTAPALQGIVNTVVPAAGPSSGQRQGRRPRQPSRFRTVQIVIIDGKPSDGIEGILINAVRRSDVLNPKEWHVGLSFSETGYLQDALDYLNDLNEVVRRRYDIASPLEAEALVRIMLMSKIPMDDVNHRPDGKDTSVMMERVRKLEWEHWEENRFRDMMHITRLALNPT